MFKNKSILITGGTGSFGNAVLKKFINTDVAEVRILSRDEKKQDDLRKKFQNEKIKLYIGDVRDYSSVTNAVRGVDYIFHAAALKQVPSCEFFPMEAFKTNVIGTDNVLEAAITYGVKKVVCLSTDKAVYPINAMGMSKGMMEKVVFSKSRLSNDTIICATRYGNVMASRGSVIPLFYNQLIQGNDITITDPNMTRFIMSLDDAVDLVLFAFNNATPGDLFVQKSPAASMRNLADAMIQLYGTSKTKSKIIGTRHGEKLYEVLLSREEMARSEDLLSYYRVPPDLRDLNYHNFIDDGSSAISITEEYNSHNTLQLDVSGLVQLIKTLKLSDN